MNKVLVYPSDAKLIAMLSLEAKIAWYASQEPRQMVYLGQQEEFQRFWFWCYIMPLRFKRALYRLKNAFGY